MPDLKKALRALEHCDLCSDAPDCPGCDYLREPDCMEHLKRDIIALLKAQEPRVLALDEIHGRMVVWLEYVDKPEVELAIGGSSACGQKCFITEYDIAIHLFDDAYNRRWRAWTAEPTDEQRKAIPWEQ